VTWLALIRGIFMGWPRPPTRPGPHANTEWVPVSEVVRLHRSRHGDCAREREKEADQDRQVE
jgi:hypothetical protein